MGNEEDSTEEREASGSLNEGLSLEQIQDGIGQSTGTKYWPY